jgi:hypothetical protein
VYDERRRFRTCHEVCRPFLSTVEYSMTLWSGAENGVIRFTGFLLEPVSHLTRLV